ncbi:MAG: hypothetical protein IJ215_03080 [Clostridia bacterium]|nr:hypothetical protein [Clostridia bacterium]
MSKNQIKRAITILMTFIIMATFGVSQVFGTEHSGVELATPADEAAVKASDNNSESNVSTEDKDLNPASESLLNNVSRKDKRIAELTDKYNDQFYGQVAYYLEVAQKYSLPVCFVGITIGAFNFLIIGNKKLDKKEQGFGWIVGFTIGLVVFNVIPLIFALFVAGR